MVDIFEVTSPMVPDREVTGEAVEMWLAEKRLEKSITSDIPRFRLQGLVKFSQGLHLKQYHTARSVYA